jgi:hypothetical protein
MKKVTSIMIAYCLSMSSIAMAGGYQQQSGQQSSQQSLSSFLSFKEACQDPAKFHNQIAPKNIEVFCKNEQVRWLPTSGNTHSLATFRNMTTQVNSDKYSSNVEAAALDSEEQVVGCPAYKQVLETVEMTRHVTCEEIIEFDGTAAEFCEAAVDSLIEQNPQAVIVQDTGKTFNMCSIEATPEQKAPVQAPKMQQEQKIKKAKHKKHFRIFS